MHQGQPVAVKIEPVMVEPAAGPYFIKLAAIGVGYQCFAFMLVHPGTKALQPIGVERGIEEDHCIFKQLVNLFSLCGRQVISADKGGIGAARFIAMYGVANVYYNGQYVKIKRG